MGGSAYQKWAAPPMWPAHLQGIFVSKLRWRAILCSKSHHRSVWCHICTGVAPCSSVADPMFKRGYIAETEQIRPPRRGIGHGDVAQSVAPTHIGGHHERTTQRPIRC